MLADYHPIRALYSSKLIPGAYTEMKVPQVEKMQGDMLKLIAIIDRLITETVQLRGTLGGVMHFVDLWTAKEDKEKPCVIRAQIAYFKIHDVISDALEGKYDPDLSFLEGRKEWYCDR